MKRLVISGAGGFLGQQLIRTVTACSDAEILAISSRQLVQPRVTCISTDDFLRDGFAFRADDVFINCFFPVDADGMRMADGMQKLFRIIALAYSGGAGAMVYISSQSVYPSQRTQPAAEGDRLCLETPYAVGKYSGEAFTDQVFADRPHTNIRLASLIGAGYDLRIINRMADQALRGDCLNVMGGMQRYGFLDVQDAARGLLLLAQSDPQTWQPVYNLGTAAVCTLLEVAECVCAEVRKQTGADAQYQVTAGQDHRNSALDAARFMRQFRWKPEIPWQQTTAAIIRSKLGK